ncbi:hypothetical protein JCM8547_003975 [Rhodosporidiobolus lusitaniae]
MAVQTTGSRPVSRPYLGMLALTWVFSVVALGLSAHLVKSGSVFPGPEGRRILVEGVFSFSWLTLFTTVLLIGSAVAPRSLFFGAAINFVLVFIGFLLAVVGLGSITAVISQFGRPGEMSSIWRAYEGIGWVATWFTFFTALWAGHDYITNKPHVEAHQAGKEDPHF